MIFEVAINVARRLTPTAANQLWVADITYVYLGRADVFVAVVMDAYSRKIVGWNLAPRLTTDPAQTALERAIEARQPAPGLIHHSDRGVQYASAANVGLLLQYSMIPSMSRPGYRVLIWTSSSTVTTMRHASIRLSVTDHRTGLKGRRPQPRNRKSRWLPA
jgi:hypothetical protein